MRAPADPAECIQAPQCSVYLSYLPGEAGAGSDRRKAQRT